MSSTLLVSTVRSVSYRHFNKSSTSQVYALVYVEYRDRCDASHGAMNLRWTLNLGILSTDSSPPGYQKINSSLIIFSARNFTSCETSLPSLFSFPFCFLVFDTLNHIVTMDEQQFVGLLESLMQRKSYYPSPCARQGILAMIWSNLD